MLTVRFYDGAGWLGFSQPLTVLRAACAQDSGAELARAQEALASGYWIAGYIRYEPGAGDALAIGIFEPPSTEPPPEGHARCSPLLPLVTRAEYNDAIARIARRIYDGDVYQVNYTMPFAFSIEGDAQACWANVARRTGARYQAYVQDGNARILSWSPELFLRFDWPLLETRPMKGTAPNDRSDALSSEKNRAEHVMIVDLLRNDLQRICDGVRVIALETIERYPSFSTMTSRIEGRVLPGAGLASVFEATFPCGSVTGAPKRAAVATIAATEKYSRGAYCGTIGFLSPQRRGWWNIAIRTAQLDGSDGTYHAGGGIVADSNAEDEWHEAFLKTAFLQQPFELWETLRGDASAHVLEAHIARLRSSAARLQIPFDETMLREELERRRAARLLRVRLAHDGRLRILDEALVESGEREVDVVLSNETVNSRDPWLGIKSSWRPHHSRAWAHASERSAFDAMLQNERGEITEGSRTNVFAQIDGQLITPPLSCGVLPGVLRGELIAEGRVRERVIYAADLERIDALYVGNSARGLLRARLHR